MAASVADPTANPLPMAAVVLPTASRLSVILPDLGRQLRHFRDSPRVVRDGAVRVHGELDAQRAQHAEGGNAHAVEPGQRVASQERRAQDQHDRHAGEHADARRR